MFTYQAGVTVSRKIKIILVATGITTATIGTIYPEHSNTTNNVCWVLVFLLCAPNK